ncbi:MAG: AMP-binding protein [Treponema sp.]|nr:AMP-binding protein [Treponema sp.]
MIDRFVSRTDFSSYEDFCENFSVKVPENFNFAWDVMEALAAETPNKRALVWCDERGAEAEYTYEDIRRHSNQAANVLRAAGISKGDPVMLILKRRYEYWPVLLALHKLGAVAIPATHLLTTKDIVYRIKAADIVSIVCVDDPELMAKVEESEQTIRQEAGDCSLRHKAFVRSVHTPSADNPAEKAQALFAQTAGALSLGAFASAVPWADFNALSAQAPDSLQRPPNVNTNSDSMLLYFTSGTTGMPKMVSHNWVYPLGHIVTALYWQRVQDGGLHYTVADTGWAKAAWGKIYGQWICGTAVFVYDYDRFAPSAMLDVIVRHKVNTFCAPPTLYRSFIKEDLSRYDFSALKNCMAAGEPLNPEIYEKFLEGTGRDLREGYGQTELTLTLCNFPWQEPRPGSLGRPSAGYDVDLLKEDGSSCETGEEGQIVIRTDRRKPVGMFDGYYRDQELTQSVWHDGAYYTGDIARRDEDGYFWFVGRSDDVIKSSGYRIGPFEVESALQEHPSVLECAVTGVPDADRGMAVKATVILAKGWEASEELKVELQNHVKKTTAPYKYPRIVEFVSELPKTISGKIRRVQIRAGDGA